MKKIFAIFAIALFPMAAPANADDKQEINRAEHGHVMHGAVHHKHGPNSPEERRLLNKQAEHKKEMEAKQHEQNPEPEDKGHE